MYWKSGTGERTLFSCNVNDGSCGCNSFELSQDKDWGGENEFWIEVNQTAHRKPSLMEALSFWWNHRRLCHLALTLDRRDLEILKNRLEEILKT